MARKKAVKKAEKADVLIDRERTANYVRSEVKTASGKRRTFDNDDEVAQMLRGKSVEDLEALAAKQGLSDRFKAWANLNPGMIRMNFGNVLRKIRKDKEEAKAAKAAKKAA